jgi:hypothetical protein
MMHTFIMRQGAITFKNDGGAQRRHPPLDISGRLPLWDQEEREWLLMELRRGNLRGRKLC